MVQIPCDGEDRRHNKQQDADPLFWFAVLVAIVARSYPNGFNSESSSGKPGFGQLEVPAGNACAGKTTLIRFRSGIGAESEHETEAYIGGLHFSAESHSVLHVIDGCFDRSCPCGSHQVIVSHAFGIGEGLFLQLARRVDPIDEPICKGLSRRNEPMLQEDFFGLARPHVPGDGEVFDHAGKKQSILGGKNWRSIRPCREETEHPRRQK